MLGGVFGKPPDCSVLQAIRPAKSRNNSGKYFIKSYFQVSELEFHELPWEACNLWECRGTDRSQGF